LPGREKDQIVDCYAAMVSMVELPPDKISAPVRDCGYWATKQPEGWLFFATAALEILAGGKLRTIANQFGG
jgi:hypothetical protein